MENIETKLEKQLEMLLELSSKTNNIEEICSLSREINKTAEILLLLFK